MKTDNINFDNNITLRFAREDDVALILEFIKGLAEYEHVLDTVGIDETVLKKYLFEDRLIEAVIGEYDGTAVGFALYYRTFSTFVGKQGIFIEDIFVKPEFRGRGVGKAFFRFIAQVAVERNCGRLEWNCLDWNEPSIKFYKSLGGQPLDDWTTYRITGDDIKTLAE